MTWDPETPTICRVPQQSGKCLLRSAQASPSLPDHVFRNDGGRFVDVTEAAGIVDRDGRGLGVVAADLDDDGKIDLFVANDTTANYFFRNMGGFGSEEVGRSRAWRPTPRAATWRAWAWPAATSTATASSDLAVTNFFGESTTLYHNHGGGLFSDRTAAAGLAAPTRFVLGFGLAALDANNDGQLDLAQANGHIGDYRPGIPYAMPPQLFLGDRTGTLIDVSDRAGPPWQLLRVARGLATGDVDNDGRIDIVLASENAPIGLLHNQPTTPKEDRAARDDHFVIFQLEGTKSNRDAVGARVKVTTAGRSQVAERFGGGSYASAGDQRLHFGLGKNRVIDHVEVAWPSGRRDRLGRLAVDKGYRLARREPDPPAPWWFLSCGTR